ncbi:MAG: PAS domain S-box protein [Sphingobacteriales bacterium]
MTKAVLSKKQNLNYFEAIFRFAKAGILITDIHGKIAAVNPAALKLFGYTKTELIGKRVEKLIPSRFYKKHRHYHDAYAEKPKTRHLGAGKDLFAVKKNGTEFPVEISLSNYQNKEGKYVIAYINNISVRKKAETEIIKLADELETKVKQRNVDLKKALWTLEKTNDTLEKAVSFQKAIVDNAGAMIIVTDKNGIIKFFNPEASRNLGYAESEVVNKKTPLIFHDKAEIERKRKELFGKFGIKVSNDFAVIIETSGRVTKKELYFTHIRKDGTTFPASLTITAIHDRNGIITGYMGVVFDISERIKTEQELIKVKELFLQLLRNYPDGTISIIDKNYNYVFTGGEIHKQLKVDPVQLIGKRAFPILPESERQLLFNMLGDVFKNKKRITDFEIPYLVDGNIYVMDMFPLVEADGSVNNAGVITRNISELKKAEDDLREALKKEKELSELKSRFVSMASHEFRTPLSTVLSSTYLIDKYKTTEDQAKREKHLQRIVTSVNMLTDTLNDFLSVGRIEEGKIQVRPTRFNLKELMITLSGELKSTLKQHQKIHYKHEGSEEVIMDTSLLKHIVMNLVSNASKFSPENSPIEIKTISRNTKVLLSVKDYGMGISKDDQKHLLERFFRGANAGNIQGTGLGLHIVSKYAELMNGTVECKSELEKGTEFVITFTNKTGLHEKDITD